MSSHSRSYSHHKFRVSTTNTSQVLNRIQQKNSHSTLVLHNYHELYTRYQEVCRQLQSIRLKLSQVQRIDVSEYELLIKKIYQYQQQIERLGIQNETIREERRISIQSETKLYTSRYQNQINRLKQDISSFQIMIIQRDQEIRRLVYDNQILISDNQKLKSIFRDEEIKYSNDISIMNAQISQLKIQLKGQSYIKRSPVIIKKQTQQLESVQIRKKEQVIKKLKIKISEIQGKYQQIFKQQLLKIKIQFENELIQHIQQYKSKAHQIIIRQVIQVFDQ